MVVWTVAPEPIDGAEALQLLRAYFVEIVERYWGRPSTEAEIDETMTEEPSDDLAALLVLRADGRPAGIAGLRVVTDGSGDEIGEVTRVYVLEALRRRGGGRVLLAAVEDTARALGLSGLRLDTRGDLEEARALYAGAGYAEVERFNDSRYANHWFAKRLI